MKKIITLLLFIALSYTSFSQNLIFSVTTTDTFCAGECTGSIAVSVTDGTPPYQYAINDLPPQDAPVFNFLCPGYYAITVTDSLNAMATIDLLVNDAPPLNASVNILSSGNLPSGVITINASGGTPPYTYNVDELGFLLEQNNIFSNIAPGSYTVGVVDVLGCAITILVIVQEIDIENSITTSGNSLTANMLADTYQWIDAHTETEIDGATNRTFTATEIGKYRVEMTINREASKNSINTKAESAALITVSSPVYEIASLSSNTLQKTNFGIHPNPAINYLKLPEITVGKNYIIYNQLGQKLISEKLNTHEIAIENLSNGLYYIKIEDLLTTKFIVKK